MNNEDESKLTAIDRLGLAYCRLNCGEWDEILGPKPIGFDDLPNQSSTSLFRRKKARSKSDFVRPAMAAIKTIIGEANVSRCWWKFALGRSEDAWFRWYVTAGFKENL